jgi:hypothetical protein
MLITSNARTDNKQPTHERTHRQQANKARFVVVVVVCAIIGCGWLLFLFSNIY